MSKVRTMKNKDHFSPSHEARLRQGPYSCTVGALNTKILDKTYFGCVTLAHFNLALESLLELITYRGRKKCRSRRCTDAHHDFIVTVSHWR